MVPHIKGTSLSYILCADPMVQPFPNSQCVLWFQQRQLEGDPSCAHIKQNTLPNPPTTEAKKYSEVLHGLYRLPVCVWSHFQNPINFATI